MSAPPPQDPGHQEPPDDHAAEVRQQLDREWRLAMVLAVALLLVGQVLLVLGWWVLALLVVAVPGTAAAVVLLRRWKRLAGG